MQLANHNVSESVSMLVLTTWTVSRSKENFVKRNFATDIDLDDFVTPPKKPLFGKRLSKVQMEALKKGPVAPNMDKSIMWDVRTFKMWSIADPHLKEKYPADMFEKPEAEKLNL